MVRAGSEGEGHGPVTLRLYKWILHVQDAGLLGVIVVLDTSREAATARAVEFARERGLWSHWFTRQAPEEISLSEPAVVAWAEMAR